MVHVNQRQVEFVFFCPDARRVCLAGDFNDWQTDRLLMSRDGSGRWRMTLHLPPGEYEFRYVVDGRWQTDYAAFGVHEGPFGVNSVLLVPPERDEKRRRDASPARSRLIAGY